MHRIRTRVLGERQGGPVRSKIDCGEQVDFKKDRRIGQDFEKSTRVREMLGTGQRRHEVFGLNI